MAPTVCMVDVPKSGTEAPCMRRKCWSERGINRHSRVELKPICIKNERWVTTCSEPVIPEARIPGEPKSDRFRSVEIRRKELLDILVRTLMLVRRNHVLQKRVDALCLETQHFIRSQLHNQRPKDEVNDVSRDSSSESSSTEDMEVNNTRQSTTTEAESKSTNHVTSTCILGKTKSGVLSNCSF